MSVDVLNGCDIKEDLHVEQRGSVSGPRPELVYNHAVLLDLKTHPLALIWPDYLDPAYKNNRGVWDPDRWHLEQKRSETPIEGEERKGRPISGLAEKILKAPGTEDAIILSPQRGSFLSGCQAAKDELSLRPDGGGSVRRGLGLEAGAGAGRRGGPPSQAEPSGPGRRVGSGRILRQDKEEAPPVRGNRVRNERENPTQREWERGGDFSKYGFRRGEEDERRGDERRGEERRGGGGGWDSYNPEDRGGGHRRGGRAGSMSGGHGRRNNEPEWMNEAVSLSDIIELKGFDDAKRNSRPNSRQSNKSDRSGRSQQQTQQQQQQQQPQHGGKEPEGFDFDQIMESVNLNSLLGGMVQGVSEAVVPTEGKPKASTQSRFSQFFQARPEPQQKKNDSRRSSIQDELVANNILRELNGEPTIRIPSPEESNKYFTPISPAAKTGHGNELMDMLKQGEKKKTAADPMVHLLEDGIKRSLGLEKQRQQQQQQHEQLLAAQRHHQQQQQQQQRQQQDNDLSAFKKLVAQVQSGPGDRPPPPPVAGGFMPGLVRPTPLGGLPFNAPTEQEILEGRAMAAQQQQRIVRQPPNIPPQLMQFLEHYPVNPEVLKRPETEPLMNCVNNGTFPVENLVAQLSNPNLPRREQELLLTVLKVKTRPFPPALASLFGGPNMVPPPRSSPLPEHLAQPPPPTAHSSRVSPLMFGGAVVPPGGAHLSVSPGPPQTQRVPSPQEMTVLTQQILQQALIKKKLEEQKENYRKKQEKPDREDKENIRGLKNAESAGSPLLAFTPTSVMRKNAAERKDSDPRPGVPELKVTVQEEGMGIERHQAPSSPGRPILKGDRPGTLELGGRTTRNNIGGGGRTPQQQSPLMPGGGLMGGGIPPNVNPLLFLANPQMQAHPPAIMGGGNQFPPGLSAIMGNHRMNQPIVPGGPPMRVGPPSPRSSHAPVSPTPLSRFFPSDVLAAAAAAGGTRQHRMPPLPTGQALTLEEIERHAAGTTVKI